MAKITIEFDDKILTKFFADIAEQAGGVVTDTSGKAGKGGKSPKTEQKVNAEAIKEAANKLLELSDKDKVKEVIAEFDCKTVTAASKLTGDDLQDCFEALQEAIAEAEEDGGSSEEEDEITVDAVKAAVQAFVKKNSKEEADEILADYDIKSVRSLNKLSQEDLEELYAEVMA